MPTHPESVRLNLEFYKKQAKSLLKAAQLNDAAALERIACHTKSTTDVPALHHAQLTIAREQGFPSWPQFQSFIRNSQLDFQGHVAAFIDAATSDYRRAESSSRSIRVSRAQGSMSLSSSVTTSASRARSPKHPRSPKKKAARKTVSRFSTSASPATPTRATTPRAPPL